MKNLFLFLVLMFSFSVISCEKEKLQPLNETEQMASFLKELISREQVKRVIPFENPTHNFSNTQILGDYGTNFRIETPFLIMDNKAWNLKDLRKYDLEKVNNIQTLGLYFY